MLLHPGVAGRSCEDCKRFRYDDRDKVGGKPELDRRTGLPVARLAGERPPCFKCPKIPAGKFPAPWNAEEWGDREWAVYRHYRQMTALGATDRERRDAIVRRHAGIIESVLADVRDRRQAVQVEMMGQMVSLLTARVG